MCINLAVICPVFNEQDNVPRVLEEWLETLNRVVGENQYSFIFFNDGSTDETLKKLQSLKTSHQQVIVIDKKNSGHGPTCLDGYKYAIDHNYAWVFQIDSDGQCDPKFFDTLWINKEKNPWQFGQRVTRDDGFVRIIITKILAAVVWLGSGVYVRDSNVPYRLMPTQPLKDFLYFIPENFFLANVVVSVFIQSKFRIKWYPIHFRARFSGVSKVRGFKFAKIAWHLLLGLLRLRPYFSKD